MIDSNDGPEDASRSVHSTETYRFSIDEERGAAVSIVEELANVLECAPTDLKPLYYDVDPLVLEQVVEGPEHQEFDFVSNGTAVTLHGDGRVVFESIDD